MCFIEYSNLIVISEGIETRPIVRIGKPEMSEKGDFSCHLTMDGFGQTIDKDVFGISVQQALALAMRQVNFLILNSKEYSEARVACEFSDGTRAPLRPEMIGALSEAD